MDEKPSHKLPRTTLIWFVLCAIAILFGIQFWAEDADKTEVIPFSEFERPVSENKVALVTVHEDVVEGTLGSPLPSGKTRFVTVHVDPALADWLATHKVTVTGAPSGGLLRAILSWLRPIVIFALVWLFSCASSPVNRALVSSTQGSNCYWRRKR